MVYPNESTIIFWRPFTPFFSRQIFHTNSGPMPLPYMFISSTGIYLAYLIINLHMNFFLIKFLTNPTLECSDLYVTLGFHLPKETNFSHAAPPIYSSAVLPNPNHTNATISPQILSYYHVMSSFMNIYFLTVTNAIILTKFVLFLLFHPLL